MTDDAESLSPELCAEFAASIEIAARTVDEAMPPAWIVLRGAIAMRAWTFLIATLWAAGALPAAAQSQETASSDSGPNIRMPGPDMGYFPNSSYTLPQGRAYIEFSPVTLSGPARGTPSHYSSPFFFRYGITDDTEFRIFGSGIQSNYGGNGDVTGFTPLAFDLKVHLWDEEKEGWIPSTALEVWLQTDLTSTVRAFDGGVQPAVNLNFDKSLPWDFTTEIMIGVAGTEDIDGRQTMVQSVQWSLNRNLTDDLGVFVTGYHNTIIGTGRGGGGGAMIGAGGMWFVSDRIAVWGSYNAGLNHDAPTTLSQLGLSYAF